MQILITGAAGMLGSAVYPAFIGAGHEVVATDLEPRDVAGLAMGRLDVRNHVDVTEAIRDARAEMVLHLAAETRLETCDADPDHAYLTNTIATHYTRSVPATATCR